MWGTDLDWGATEASRNKAAFLEWSDMASVNRGEEAVGAKVLTEWSKHWKFSAPKHGVSMCVCVCVCVRVRQNSGDEWAELLGRQWSRREWMKRNLKNVT
jgi:hypothetical protein